MNAHVEGVLEELWQELIPHTSELYVGSKAMRKKASNRCKHRRYKSCVGGLMRSHCSAVRLG